MNVDLLVLAGLLFFIISSLYATVGHAGASGYLAVMALLSFPAQEIKPVSLILNIVVAAIGSYRYLKEGYFDKKVFLLFAVFSIPMAFAGGYFKVEEKQFKLLAGAFLIISAIMIALKTFQKNKRDYEVVSVPVWKAGLIGGAIGYVSGLIGIGGGIFLSPLLMLFHWAKPKNVSGIAALFILVNSVLGLLGHVSSLSSVPRHTFFWVLAVTAGGFLGSYVGTKKIDTKGIYIVLIIVLVTAGAKMLFF
jgi:uncharacterized protein